MFKAAVALSLIAAQLVTCTHAYGVPSLHIRTSDGDSAPVQIKLDINSCQDKEKICRKASKSTATAPPEVKACAAVANKWKDDEWETVPPSVAMGKYDYNPQTPCEAYVANLGSLSSIKFYRNDLATFLSVASEKCFSDTASDFDEVECKIGYNGGDVRITVTGWTKKETPAATDAVKSSAAPSNPPASSAA